MSTPTRRTTTRTTPPPIRHQPEINTEHTRERDQLTTKKNHNITITHREPARPTFKIHSRRRT